MYAQRRPCGPASGGASALGAGSGGSTVDDEVWAELSALRRRCQTQEEQIDRQELIVASLQQQLQGGQGPGPGGGGGGDGGREAAVLRQQLRLAEVRRDDGRWTGGVAGMKGKGGGVQVSEQRGRELRFGAQSLCKAVAWWAPA